MATKKKTTKKTTKPKSKTTKKTATKKMATKKAAPKKMAMKKTATKKAATKKVATKKAATKKTTTKLVAKKSGTLASTVSSTQAMAAHTQRLNVGEVVPNFEVPSTGGQRVSLQGLKGKAVVLYFYPKDATPGCTIEGHEFTKLHEQFKAAGAEVYGVSKDDIESHEKFKTDECYSIDLLSDTSGELCQMFDVIKMKNMYGREYQGIERSTFVIDGDGKLIQEWRGVKVEGHAQQVLEFLRSR